MVEKNPYETNGPVEVPNFMNSEKKEDLDMSVFDLDEEVEETEVERKPLKKEMLIALIACVVAFALLVGLIVTIIVKNNAYESLESTYKTYQTTTETKLSQQKTEIEKLTAENKTLTEENAKLKETQKPVTPGETTGVKDDGTLTTGNYVIAVGMNVRKSPDVSAAIIDRTTVPQNIKEITNDNGTMVEGETVKVLEISPNGSAPTVWGKIADGCWICLRNNGTAYYKK